MCDVAVTLVTEFIREHLFSPAFSWDKYEFKKRSYEQWAALEIIERIMDRPLDPPIDIIESFMFEMYYYAYHSGDDEQRTFIFRTAYETAEEIILLFV